MDQVALVEGLSKSRETLDTIVAMIRGKPNDVRSLMHLD